MIDSIHMGWRHVLFANWPVDPATVAPHLPDALTLDTYDGQAWLSVVPFTNVDVRFSWLPFGGFQLPELNLRTYVSPGDEPGIYFFSLDADGLLGVLGARFLHSLPYYYAAMDLSVAGDRVTFRSRRRHPGARPLKFAAAYGPAGDTFEAESDPLARFLTERYRYYTEDQAGCIRYATVEHDTWRLAPARVTFGPNDCFAANWFDHPETEPVHFYSRGVDTLASGSKRVDEPDTVQRKPDVF